MCQQIVNLFYKTTHTIDYKMTNNKKIVLQLQNSASKKFDHGQ